MELEVLTFIPLITVDGVSTTLPTYRSKHIFTGSVMNRITTTSLLLSK